jgi:hypothetical protein
MELEKLKPLISENNLSNFSLTSIIQFLVSSFDSFKLPDSILMLL